MQFMSRNVGALSGVSSLYSGSASSGGDIQTFQESGHHPQEELPHPTVTQASPTGRITLLPSSALLLFVVILTTVSQTKMCSSNMHCQRAGTRQAPPYLPSPPGNLSSGIQARLFVISDALFSPCIIPTQLAQI